VLESPLTQFSRLRIHERNLLNARVVIATYNQHIGSFPPSLGLVGTTKSTQVQGADIVMKSFACNRYRSTTLFVSAGLMPVDYVDELPGILAELEF
jgi:hypothetical protein